MGAEAAKKTRIPRPRSSQQWGSCPPHRHASRPKHQHVRMFVITRWVYNSLSLSFNGVWCLYVSIYIYVCVYISIYLLFIYLFNGGCKPNYKCGALSCRCLKQVCISVSMPGSEELNISGYWPHAEEKGTLPTLHDVLEGVWPNYIKCRSRGMQYI